MSFLFLPALYAKKWLFASLRVVCRIGGLTDSTTIDLYNNKGKGTKMRQKGEEREEKKKKKRVKREGGKKEKKRETNNLWI